MDIFNSIEFQPFIIYIWLFIIGAFFGSFFNVLADRLSKEQTMGGRSRCDKCKHKLAWFDLIPIISFTSLSGKCRYCRAPISIGHLVAEIITGVIFILTYILSSNIYSGNQFVLIHLAIAGVIIVMLLADFRYQIIPDEMQIALFILGVIQLLFQQSLPQIIDLERIWSIGFLTAFGYQLGYGAIVFGPIFLIYAVTKGKGMGFGDVKLAFNMGFILGVWAGLTALYLGFISGGIAGLYLLLTRKKKMKSKIAFGPFLLLGLYIMLFFSKEILAFIQNYIGYY
jgi:prepilin signal peptidase PulO-like enzyme (type II secretory pathway)